MLLSVLNIGTVPSSANEVFALLMVKQSERRRRKIGMPESHHRRKVKVKLCLTSSQTSLVFMILDAGKKRSKGKSRAGGANSTNGTASSVASETSTRPSSSLNSDSRLGGAASPLSVSSPSPPINTRSESVASSDQESSLPASSSAVPGQPLLDDGESDDDVDPWF